MKKIIVTIVTFIILSILMINVSIAATGTLTASEVNFREGASTDTEPIQELNKGTKVNIVGEEGDWYKVTYKGKEGYVKKDYIKVDDEEKTEKKEEQPAETNNNAEITSTILIEDTSLYVLPLLGSSKIATLTPSESIEVLSKAGKWSFIQTPKLSGWVISSKLTTVNGEQQSTNTEENVEKKEEKQEEQKQEEKKETSENSDDKVTMVKYVNVYSVNIRKEPSMDADILDSLDKNDSADIVGKEGEWYKVKTEDGTGYIKAEYLSDEKSAE